MAVGSAIAGQWQRVTALVTGRKGSWLVLILAAALVALVSSFAAQPAAGGGGSALPPGAESAQAQELTEKFSEQDAPIFAVLSRDGAQLGDADMRAAQEMAGRLSSETGQEASPAMPSSDGQAALVVVPVRADLSSPDNAQMVEDVRAAAVQDLPDEVTVQVTGGPAFGADITNSFDGANFLLLSVTIAVVAVLLLITYRSPVLWLVPLIVVGLAAQLATTVDGQLQEWFGLQFDSGIISVLVFGAGTNYALLLISRYREQLRRDADHRIALRDALRSTTSAILASNATVVLALLTLVFATIPSTSGLGIAAAVGLVFALLFGLLVLPAALAVCGRGLFWPFVPHHGDAEKSHSGAWFKVASGVAKRPAKVLSASVVVLAVMMLGLFSVEIGLTKTEQFRVSSEAVDGFETMSQHYPDQATETVTIISHSVQADAVVDAALSVEGVDEVTRAADSPDGWSKITATSTLAADTDDSYDMVQELRGAVHEVDGADAVVGGDTAESLDIREAAIDDLKLIVPIILLLVFGILAVLLRAIVAPLVLSVVNVVSAAAAIGAGTWVGKQFFGFPALDVNVPLLAFLFLFALGVDYTIFVVSRARQEAHDHGTSEGMVRAVATTGSVITSAGIVLAAVFAALGVLPLMTLAQLGLIVGLGVLIDTLLVRTVVIPALFELIGDRVWWPGEMSREPAHNTRQGGGSV